MLRVIIACMLAGSALAACASDADPIDPTLKPASFDEFVVSYAHFTCDALVPCCKSDHVAYDAAECREGQALRARILFGGLSGLKFDGHKAEECIAQSIAEFAQCSVLQPAHGACARVTHGDLPLGSECKHAVQCAEPEGKTIQCANGHCALGAVAKLGDPCDGSCDGGVCQGLSEHPCHRSDGVYCDWSQNECVTLIPTGGSGCKTLGDTSCVAGAFCDNLQDRCVARGAAGAPCDSWGMCDDDHYCDGATCQARIEPGEACTEGITGCRNGSCEGGVCSSRLNDVCH